MIILKLINLMIKLILRLNNEFYNIKILKILINYILFINMKIFKK